MAVQSDISSIQYQGNSSTVTPYPVPFYFFDAGDVRVFLLPDGGSETELIEGTDFTVTGAGNENGGEVTTAVAYDSTNKLTIVREVDPTQLTVYDENDKFPAKSHERALDKLTMIVQQALRAVSRSLRFTDSFPGGASFAPTVNTILGISGVGNARTFNQSELATWLNLTIPGIIGQPTMTFADAGERAIAIPEFIGQVGLQRDTPSLWVSTGLTAGDWVVVFDPSMLLIADGSISAAKLAAALDFSANTAFVLPGNAINARTAASSLINADEFLFWDSVAGDLKKITRQNLKNSMLPVGTVLQTLYSQSTSTATFSAVIPYDNTIPQNSEGTEIFSQAITPSSTSNKVLVEWQLWGSRNGSGVCFISALFRNSDVDAIAVISGQTGFTNQVSGQVCGFYLDSPNTTSPTTYSLRIGPNNNSFQLNGTGTATLFNGRAVATFKVSEIKG
jgi:hypothetical protein